MRCLNDHQIPSQATFCPHCGAGAADKPFNNMLLHDLDQRSELELEAYEVPRQKVGPILAFVAVLVFVAGGLAYNLSSSDQAVPTPEAAPVAVAAPAAAAAVAAVAPPVLAPVFKGDALKVALAPAFSTISYEGRPLVDIRTAVGSRYTTPDERTKAIEVRIRHAWETSVSENIKPKFTAVARGNIHEVVWTRAGETDFRVMDVTDRDVRMWEKANGKTTRAILANLLADRLGALTERHPNS